MELSRICMGRNTKQQQRNNINNSTTQRIQEMNVYKFKGKWDFCHEFKNHKNAEDNSVGAGFSWPPRCYSCNFCRREFSSAQALGGHMNVHRRDRARLRQFSPPKIIQNLDPNPSLNPNPSSMSSHWTRFPHYTSPLPPFFPSSHSRFSSCLDSNHASIERSRQEGVLFENLMKPSAGDLMKMESQKAFNSVEKFGSFVCEKGCENVKKDLVRLDLEIGLISQYSHAELDLELRLGYT
ncbi:transcriptional regulator SUPERMAN-like [Primulina huaijiensis]|uniref:transcriptional regulator SUPERMAN-like n=1 Tax=Primulina huaijiensis TaxID=1492673 RepID=UPI003CC71BE5